MRMLPGIFGDSFFDDFMDYPLEKYFLMPSHDTGKNFHAVMKTDVKEKDNNYEIAMDLPGIKKDDVKIELDSGYLTVSACRCSENEEQDSGHKYIKKERYSGHYKRSFFVGENISNEDVRAKFEDGVLMITLPKNKPDELKANKNITIE